MQLFLSRVEPSLQRTCHAAIYSSKYPLISGRTRMSWDGGRVTAGNIYSDIDAICVRARFVACDAGLISRRISWDVAVPGSEDTSQWRHSRVKAEMMKTRVANRVRSRRSKSSRYFCDKRLDCLRLTSIDLYDLLLDSVELRRGICSTDSDCPSINKNRKKQGS